MKVVVVQGGLGNQLFQYAFACYLRKKTSEQVQVYWKSNAGVSRNLWLKLFPITLPFVSDKKSKYYRKHILRKKKKWYSQFLFALNNFQFKVVAENKSLPLEQQIYPNERNVFYDGYWQYASMVNSVRDLLLRELQPFPTPGAESQKIADRIRNSKMATAIHLRTAWRYGLDITDNKQKTHFKHSQTSLSCNYYMKAINHIKNVCDSSTFFVFADDPDMARSLLSGIDFAGNVFYLSHHNRTDLEDLFLMQLCQNFILSNSSFAWWGHWFSYALRPYRKSLVMMPENWMGYGTDRSRSLQLQAHDKVLLISDD